MKARSAECRTRSPKNEDEIFKESKAAWNDPNDWCLLLSSHQISKLSNKEFDVVISIGNKIYGKRGSK